jgi:hypothetical protein
MPDTEEYCFVIGPIGDEASPERIHADWLFKGIILPVFEKDFPDWIVERADKIATPGMINAQIINRLHDVALVIADLSFHNANAFYELSIRHKVGKPIIHMIGKGQNIPFDVVPHRAIQFSHNHPDDHEEAREHLRAAVAEAIKPGFEPDNPILHARGRLELEQKAPPAMKVLSDEIASLRARLDRLETALPALVGPPHGIPLWALGDSPIARALAEAATEKQSSSSRPRGLLDLGPRGAARGLLDLK